MIFLKTFLYPNNIVVCDGFEFFLSPKMLGRPSLLSTVQSSDVIRIVERKRNFAFNTVNVQFDNVKITPPYIEFIDTSEGHVYEKTITIINCGIVNASVRVGCPKSFAFQINPIKRKTMLSPGLSIKRKVTYHYSKATHLPYAEIPIYINEVLYMYPLLITTSEARLGVIPEEIDFGDLNVMCVSNIQSITIKNTSGRSVRFIADLYACQNTVVVEPSRGILKPKVETKLSLQIMVNEIGPYCTQFWIKCSMPVLIKVSANIIQPRFEIQHPIPANERTMLLNFGRTYFGATVKKTLIIRNYNASKTIFCTSVVHLGKEMVFREATNTVPDLDAFRCFPTGGQFYPMETKTITVSCTPIKPVNAGNRILVKEYFQWFKFVEIFFQEMHSFDLISDYDDEIIKETSELKYPTQTFMSSATLVSRGRPVNGDYDYNILDTISEEAKSISERDGSKIVTLLCAKAYTPDVTLVPSEIFVKDLSLMDVVKRVINIKNNNEHLSIYFEHKPIVYVQIEPSNGCIKAQGQLDLLVKITASEPGKRKIKIVFDLLYPHVPENEGQGMQIVGQIEANIQIESTTVGKKPIPKINHGITPVITHEVGFLPEDVSFDTNLPIPKPIVVDKIKSVDKLSDIIAFPNDMPKSLRPRRNVTKRCTTIFAKIPRTVANWDEYDMPEAKKRAYEISRAYMDIYFEQKREIKDAKLKKAAIQEKRKHELENYTVTEKEHLLLLNTPKEECTTFREIIKKPIRMSCLPMSPEALHNFKIYPSSITLKRVLIESSMTEKIILQNLNDFNVSIIIRTTRQFVKPMEGNYRILKAHSSEEVELLFTAPSKSGLIFVQIEIIINESHFSEIDFTAQVVETMIELDPTEVIFQNLEDYKVLTVKNLMHGNVSFKWKLNSDCYRIVPSSGVIASQRIMKCAIYKKKCENVCIDTEAELVVLFTNVYKTTSLLLRYSPFNIFLINDYLNVPNIPLNTKLKKSVILRNAEMCCVTFAITGHKHVPGLTIIPESGILEGKSDKLIDVIFHFTATLRLSCTLFISIGNLTEINLTIDATVVYPLYTIQPEAVHLKKIRCFSTNSIPFVIANKSSCRSKFQILLDELPEYVVKENADYTSNSIPIEGFYLDPGESKKLCLFFTPRTIDTLKFDLPIFVNNILGPPVFNVAQNYMYFVEKERSIYESISEIELDTVDHSLQTMTIASMVTNIDLDFSRINFVFEINLLKKGPDGMQRLVITNKGDSENEFCIRIDDIKQHLYIQHSDNEIFEDFENSVSANLKVGEQAILDIICTSAPEISTTLHAPVFVRNYPNGPLFTYLTFSLICHPPTINPREEIVFFPPIPSCCGVGKTTTVELINHSVDCSITVETDLNDLIITVCDRQRIDKNAEIVPLNLFVYFKENGTIDTSVNLSCSCGSSQKVRVKGCAENCVFTIHGFLRVFQGAGYEYAEENEDCDEMNYSSPFCVYSGKRLDISQHTCQFFPNDRTSNSKYYLHMKRTLETMEHVVFSQVFNNDKFLRIPDGFSTMPVKLKNKKTKGKSNEQECYLYYEQFLINLLGPNITSIIWCGKKFTLPSDDVHRVTRVLDSYSTAITFFNSKGAVLPYVSPEYLLSYDDYMIFVNQIAPQKKVKIELTVPYKEDDFYLRSQQCWLDLILQTYKVVVLFQIRLMPFIPNCTGNNSSENEMGTLYAEETSISITDDVDPFEAPHPTEENLHCTRTDFSKTQSELIILSWLENSYNTQIKTWNAISKDCILEERQLTNFSEDLEDSLVLLATVSLYCPFFNDYINDIYFCVESLENRHHNAIILMEWLRQLHAVVTMNPENITDTETGICTFILCVYLFQFLPSIYPHKTITIEADINKSANRTISVSNQEKQKIMYNVTLFKNENNCVSISHTEFVVQSKKSVKIKLTFTANVIRTVKVFVLINGENRGYRFAKSICYLLEGIVTFDHCTTTAKFEVPVYNSVDVNLPVRSPYPVQTSYGIFYTTGATKNSNSINILSWKTKMELPTLPNRITSQMSELVCDEKGDGILQFRAYCLSQIVQTYFIFLTNPKTGDFCIEIKIIPDTKNIPHNVIPIEMNEMQFLKTVAAKCTCENRKAFPVTDVVKAKACPKIINVRIPCLNNDLWTGVGKLFSTTVAGLKYWNKDYVVTSFPGSKLIYFAVDNVDEEYRNDIVQLYREDVQYKLVFNTPPTVSMPNTVFIKDVRNIKESVEVSMHINANNLSDLKNFTITLISDDLMEKRYYDVIWTIPLNFESNLMKSQSALVTTCSTTDVDQK